MSENCRRKVVEEAQGYRCEHCNKSFLSYRPTYMITAKVSDFTDSIYVNFAREHGAALMGKKPHNSHFYRDERRGVQRIQRNRDRGARLGLLRLVALQDIQHYGKGQI
jgi:hypothetical protein